ncbi:hypothetical protein F2P81_023281 [Scophthalmus maximus]|uniref:Uncharacterized protein n=1 Tax=Scophthalmus maximus TaxID=52904 RepID=A0A6A4RW07_SCOMX|nr:hypothetical protein F2P81_023281 [Scophthalmus maximus]
MEKTNNDNDDDNNNDDDDGERREQSASLERRSDTTSGVCSARFSEWTRDEREPLTLFIVYLSTQQHLKFLIRGGIGFGGSTVCSVISAS